MKFIGISFLLTIVLCVLSNATGQILFLQIGRVFAGLTLILFFLWFVFGGIFHPTAKQFVNSNTKFRIVKDGFGAYFVQIRIFGLWFYHGYIVDEGDSEGSLLVHKKHTYKTKEAAEEAITELKKIGKKKDKAAKPKEYFNY